MEPVLVYAQDAGGARQILPVIREILKDGYPPIEVVVHRDAERIFQNIECRLHALSEETRPPLDRDGARRFLEKINPKVLFCTTSNNRKDHSNGELIRAARETGIPTFALFDHWKGWKKIGRCGEPLCYMPDLLGVLDEKAIDFGVSWGVPRERMVAVGHPWLESLSESSDENTRRARKKLGLRDDEVACVFFSQPMVKEINGRTVFESLMNLPIGQHIYEVLSLFRGKIEKMGRPVRLFLRPHPKEGPPGNNMGLEPVDSRISSLELAQAANLVLGLDSMILYEAAFGGSVVISLKFKEFLDVDENFQCWPDILPSAETIKDCEDLIEDNMSSILGNHNAPIISYPLPRNACERCKEKLLHLYEKEIYTGEKEG